MGKFAALYQSENASKHSYEAYMQDFLLTIRVCIG
jgi:hypothetical protein